MMQHDSDRIKAFEERLAAGNELLEAFIERIRADVQARMRNEAHSVREYRVVLEFGFIRLVEVAGDKYKPDSFEGIRVIN